MQKSKFTSRFFSIGVLLLVLIRLFLNSIVPLMDKTEARYAEIARIMAETNNYITPQIDYGVPFWAKPPLSTWLSAISIEVFGSNEFAVRLPYLLLSILVVFLLGKYATREKLPFFLPGFIALTIPQFLIHAGVVSTDTALMFSVTLVMLSFWEAMQQPSNKKWQYIGFIALGLGLLAKGPIIAILTLPPIFAWSLITKNFLTIFKRISVFLGLIITLLIAVPWYYLAEQKTPGFIDYFIIGEHFKRFFDSSWSGDKYGFPKQQPLGIIWIFLIVFALPWIQVVIGKVWKTRKTILQNSWLVFLLCWLLWTPLFFTISKSLIHPYIMPVMAPIALLTTYFWKTIKKQKLIVSIALIIPIISFVAGIYGNVSGQLTYLSKTDKYLIEKTKDIHIPLYYFKEKSYSSQFYSEGKIKSVTKKELAKLITNKKPTKLIISKKNKEKLKNLLPKNTKVISESNKNLMLYIK